MANCNLWDVVRVPFPYTDRPVRQHRPALVISNGHEADHGLLWVLMITSAENRRWDDDVLVCDEHSAGLPVPSVVRCAKIATIEAREAESIGTLTSSDRTKVARHLASVLAVVTGH